MALTVRALRPGNAEDEATFRDINLEWIERFSIGGRAESAPAGNG